MQIFLHCYSWIVYFDKFNDSITIEVTALLLYCISKLTLVFSLTAKMLSVCIYVLYN